MKRYISVFQMITRCSIYKVVGLLLVLIFAELGSFWIALQQPLAEIQPNLEEIVDQSHLVFMFGIAYLLLTVILVLPGTNIGSVQSYTLKRLRIKESKVFLLQCIYNVFCYVILWATQLGVLLVASNYYMTHKTDAILTNQTVFLAFHRNGFMHSILPMQDMMNWVVLISIIIGTGCFAAEFTSRQRRGKVAWILIFFVATACISFVRALGDNPVFMILAMIIWLGYYSLRAFFYKFNEGVDADET